MFLASEIIIYTTVQPFSWQIERGHALTLEEFRRLLGDRAKQLAATFCVGFRKSSPEHQALYVNMDDEMLGSKLAFLLHESAGHYLSEIMNRMDDYYMCRRKACCFVGPNTHWIQSASGGQFRCPDCGEQYKPWVKLKGSDTFLPCNKILIFGVLDGLDHDKFEFPTEIQMQLTLWPDIVTESLINEFKAETNIASAQCHWWSCLYKYEFSFLEEITAIGLKEWVNKPFAELEKELTSRSFTMHRSYFLKKPLQTEILNKIHQLNAEGLLKRWDCTHLQDGYLGFNYNYTEGEAVLSARDVMRM